MCHYVALILLYTSRLLLPKHMPHPSFIPFQTTAFLASMSKISGAAASWCTCTVFIDSLISDERCESTGRVSRLQRTMTRLHGLVCLKHLIIIADGLDSQF